MPSLGFPEIATLVLLALLIFGPERLPEIARTVGKTIGAVKREASSTLEELKRHAEVDEFKGVAKDLRAQAADLRKSSQLSGPVASPDGPSASAAKTVSAEIAPPFDPDAT